MVKLLLSYLAVIIVLFFASYSIHSYFLGASVSELPYSLMSAYLFHAIASLILVFVFELLALTEQYNEQLGFLYLASMTLKIVFFCIFFKEVLFSNIVLSKTGSISLIIPLFIFILYEVLIIVKTLNRSV